MIPKDRRCLLYLLNYMGLMFWNCRGAGNSNFSALVHDMKKINDFDILAVVEPRVSGAIADRIIDKLKFNSSYRIEAQGRSGGIWLLWNNNKFDIKILNSSIHCIHGVVDEGKDSAWLFTVVYANPNALKKKQCFEEVANLARHIVQPWLVVGDFNEILSPSEKVGGVEVDLRRCIRFGRWVQDCGLIDLGSYGHKFTWRGAQRQGFGRVYERLDIGFGNQQWRLKFQKARVKVLPRIRSDHHPILVELVDHCHRHHNTRLFCFEAAWVSHHLFADFIKRNWEDRKYLKANLDSLTTQLRDWNKSVFGNIFQRKRRVLSRLNGIQRSLPEYNNKFLSKLEKELSTEYLQITKQEEIHWFQKSRCNWIVFGDKNSSYFQTKTIIRRQRNKIKMLKNENNIWVEDENSLKIMASRFFQNLFRKETSVVQGDQIKTSFPEIDSTHLSLLSKQVTNEEIKAAIFDMKPYSAPGPVGFQPFFYQSQWSVVGKSVCDFIKLI